MVRNFSTLAAAGAALFLLLAPARAADFKYTGLFRLRGVTSDDTDRNASRHDGVQGYDAQVRPRFTAISEGGKIWALYEPDFRTGDHLVGSLGRGRVPVGVNRFVVDFAVPGTTLRGRWGKTDYTDPSKEIFDDTGRSRYNGIALYGPLAGGFSLSLFTTKVFEADAGGTRLDVRARDADAYFAALTWKAAPALAVTPWAALSRRNRDKTAGTAGYGLYYFALHAAAGAGALRAEATGIFESGTIAENPRRLAAPSAKRPDVGVEAWALLLRAWLTLGRLKVGFYGTFMTGDDDTVPAAGNQAGQPDKELTRFVLPGNNATGWVEAGQIMTSRRWMTLSNRVPGTVTNNTLVGNGRNTQLNGAVVLEGLFEYRATKTLLLRGSVSVYRSPEKAPDLCTDADGSGACDPGEPAAVTHTNGKNFGTELNLGFRWWIHKSLELRPVAAYLFAGDYGTVRGGKAPDDTWQVMYSLRHVF